jgi:hypothetical protein
MTALATPFHRVLALLDVFGAAISAAAATREHRRPAAADLQRLGIAPASFPKSF